MSIIWKICPTVYFAKVASKRSPSRKEDHLEKKPISKRSPYRKEAHKKNKKRKKEKKKRKKNLINYII